MAAGTVTIFGDSGRAFRGIKIVTGQIVLDGAGGSPIDLSAFGAQCLGGVCSISGSAALGDDPNSISSSPSGATLNVYPFKNVSGTDPTQTASSNNTRVIDFVATMRA
jgi:hypothetical protein